MTLKTRIANTLSFAHLGLRGSRAEGGDKPDDEGKPKEAKGAKGSPEDDEERKKRDDETDDEYNARMAKLDEEDDPAASGGSAKDKSGKGGEEDDDDEEMSGKSAAAQARGRERARCASIFASQYAQGREAFAAHLAFNTTMPRSEAIAMLKMAPAAAAPAPAAAPGSRAAHPGRGAQNPDVTSTAAPPKARKQQISDSWGAAHEAITTAGRRPLANNARHR